MHSQSTYLNCFHWGLRLSYLGNHSRKRTFDATSASERPCVTSECSTSTPACRTPRTQSPSTQLPPRSRPSTASFVLPSEAPARSPSTAAHRATPVSPVPPAQYGPAE